MDSFQIDFMLGVVRLSLFCPASGVTSEIKRSFHCPHPLSDRVEALLKVGNDIVNMLGTDRETDGVGLDALVQQFFA